MKKNWYYAAGLALVFASCDNSETDTDDHDHDHDLTIPSSYVSANYDDNVVTESAVLAELSTMVGAANDAEANAQTVQVGAITNPSTLASITVPAYKTLVDSWLVELVKSANSPDGFQTPAVGESPASDQDGGLLGSRLLDENGLELEQMVDKGLYGAALYNHAVALIEAGNLSAGDIDKLVEVFGTDASWSADDAGQAAKYAKRRSNNTDMTGFFYEMKTALITAKAAIEEGAEHDDDRDAALASYLLNWEKSNFATVINYCYGTKAKIQEAATMSEGDEKDALLGDALHAYAEGVGFAHGFKGVSNKMITDAQIDSILALLLAEEGEVPTSYRFLNEASLLANLDQIISDIQAIYGFSDTEVTGFYTNN